MKKVVFAVLILCVISTSAFARKRGVVPYCTGCEYIKVVQELPDEDKFFSEEYNGYLDLGYFYKQTWIAKVPIWNSDGQYCLTIKDKDVYFDITDDQLDEIVKEYKLQLAGNPLPFWDKIGGKLVILLLIIVGIGGKFKDVLLGLFRKEK